MIWPTKKLGEVLDYEQPGHYIVGSKNYSDDYKTPVLTAGKTFILGNTEEKENIFPVKKLPVIIFDDFTTAIKFVDFPFKIKSSAMKILHAKKDVADIKYLFYLLQTIELNHVTHKRYWISEYSNIEIPLPPMEEQWRIVKKIEELFAKIDEAQKLREEAQKDSAALSSRCLSNLFDSLRQKFDTEEFGQVAQLVRGPFGGSLKKDIFVESGYAVYEQGNVIKNNLKDFRYFISKEKFSEMIRFAVQPGDILMSCSGTIGRLAVSSDHCKEGIINQALLKIRPKKNILVNYLRYALQDYILQNILKHTKGSAIKNIVAVSMLKKIRIPLPPLAEQKKIVEYLDSLSEKIRTLQKLQSETATDFAALKQSILHKAFSGELLIEGERVETITTT